jgi:preprotein translocase subunit SecA
LGGSEIEDLEPRLQNGLRRLLGDEGFESVAFTGSLSGASEDVRAKIAAALGRLSLTEYFRRLILSVGDRLWVEYLTQVEALRTSIGLEAYAQRDPLVQYKSRAFDMFQQLLSEIRSGVVSRLFRLPAPAQAQPTEAASRESPQQVAVPARVASTDTPAEAEKRKHRRRRH